MKSLPATLILSLIFSMYGYAQIENGSFENWQNEIPDRWTTIDGGITISKENRVKKDGNYAANIKVNTVTQSNTDFLQNVSVIPGNTYTFSTYIYHTEGFVKARFFVDGYRNYSDNEQKEIWQKISYTIVPETSTINVGLRFYDTPGFDGSESVCVDQLEMKTSTNACEGSVVTLNLLTDNYGGETSWLLTKDNDMILEGKNFDDNTNYEETACLENGKYEFTITDSYGDGICCSEGNGFYQIKIDGNTVKSGGTFGRSENYSFTIGSGNSTAIGTGYYASVNGLSGYNLKEELHEIIDDHRNRGYKAVWEFVIENDIDRYYEKDNSVLDIYSENTTTTDPFNYIPATNQCGISRTQGDCYNREHSFPKSWFGGKIEPMNSDIHHIFPTDGYVNTRRSSYPYGEVKNERFTSENGSKLGKSELEITVFEPSDAFKGDLARAYFYMATRYEDQITAWETITSNGDLVLDGSRDQVFEPWMLNTLLKWHKEDPVSKKEIDRNNAAFIYQGNRNPYVDHPEYVSLIWKPVTDNNSTQIITNVRENEYAMNQHFLIHDFNNEIVITGNFQQQSIVELYTIKGTIIWGIKVEQATSKISIPSSHLKNQLYFVRITNKTGIQSEKIMINH